MAGATLTAAAKQAELLKENGNTYFKKERYGAAIDAYTGAITLCPDVPVYLTNRAVCHRKRNDWTKVEEDCRKAIKLDQNSVKVLLPSILDLKSGDLVPAFAEQIIAGGLVMGHYMLGLALLQRKEYAEGVKELEKALDLGRDENPNSMVEEIWQELAKAKYLEWEQESTKRTWNLQSLKEACETALVKHFLDCYEAEGFLDDKVATHSKQLEGLKRVFKRAAEDDTPTEVPDYLCCKITLDIFRDPVIAPSGITYERGVILDHLEKVGNFDPTTREPLDPSQLIPNLAIKEAVQAYLDRHGWAYKTE